MSFLTTEADGAASAHAQLAPVRKTKRLQGVSVARDLGLALLLGALVAGGLLFSLSVEPSSPKIELPRPSPRPALLDQPYRPRARAAR